MGDFHTGQSGDHRLEIEQSFEAALRNLGLVRRVLGVPGGIFQYVSLNKRGRDAIGIARADERAEDLILGGDLAQLIEQSVLAARRRQIQWPPEPDLRRHRSVDECVERRKTADCQHLLNVGLARTDVPPDETVRPGEYTRLLGGRGNASRWNLRFIRCQWRGLRHGVKLKTAFHKSREFSTLELATLTGIEPVLPP